MKRFRSFAPAALVVAVLVAFATAPALAQQKVTDLVPSDALVVIKIRNVQEVSNKMAALAQQFGIAGLNPAAADPLGAFEQMTGMSAGVNKAGDAAIVFLNIPEGAVKKIAAAAPVEGAAPAEGEAAEGEGEESDDEPPMLVLVPVSDYQAFLKGFGEPRKEGELAIVNFKDQQTDVYVANWGTFAAMSHKKEHLAKKPDGLKVAGVAGKELETKDITVFGNMKAVRARALPKLKENREQMLAKADEAMAEQGQLDEKYRPIARAAINQGLNLIEQLLTETDAGTYGLALSNEGINTTVLAEFAAGSKFGNTVKQLKGTNGSLLTGLPEGKHLIFGGGASNPQATIQLMNDVIGPVEKELAGLGDEGKAIQTYLGAMREYIGAMQQWRFGMIAPGGKLGEEAIFQGVGIVHGDAAKLSSSYRQMLQQSDELMAMFGSAQVPTKTEIKEKAKTVDGVALDMFQTTFGGADAQDPQAQQVAQMMTMMYGPNGLQGYVGVVGNKLVQGTNVSDAVLEQVIKSAKADQDVLSKQPGLPLTKKQLPQTRLAEVYIPLDVVVNTAVTYANQFGMPLKMQMPPNLPPIGMTIAAEGTAFRLDSHVPSQLIQSLVMAGMQAAMQMQQGAQPGGPGGL